MPGREADGSRRRRARARDHPLRAAILDSLENGRAAPVRALCGELPGSPGLSNVSYHLAVLADAGLVESSGEAGRRLYRLA